MSIVLASTAVAESPLFVVIVGVMLTAAITVASAVVGLFMKMSAMAATMKAMQEDVNQLSRDPDVMRWSDWNKRATDPEGVTRRSRRRN